MYWTNLPFREANAFDRPSMKTLSYRQAQYENVKLSTGPIWKR